jgi:hypothetical protein
MSAPAPVASAQAAADPPAQAPAAAPADPLAQREGKCNMLTNDLLALPANGKLLIKIDNGAFQTMINGKPPADPNVPEGLVLWSINTVRSLVTQRMYKGKDAVYTPLNPFYNLCAQQTNGRWQEIALVPRRPELDYVRANIDAGINCKFDSNLFIPMSIVLTDGGAFNPQYVKMRAALVSIIEYSIEKGLVEVPAYDGVAKIAPPCRGPILELLMRWSMAVSLMSHKQFNVLIGDEAKTRNVDHNNDAARAAHWAHYYDTIH